MKTNKLLKSVTFILTLSIVLSQLTFIQTAFAATAKEEAKASIATNKVAVDCFDEKVKYYQDDVKIAEDAFSTCKIDATKKENETISTKCYKEEIKGQKICISDWEGACTHIFDPTDPTDRKLNKCYADNKGTFDTCFDKTGTTYDKCYNTALETKTKDLKECDEVIKKVYQNYVDECETGSVGITPGLQARLDANPALKKCFDEKVGKKKEDFDSLNTAKTKCEDIANKLYEAEKKKEEESCDWKILQEKFKACDNLLTIGQTACAKSTIKLEGAAKTKAYADCYKAYEVRRETCLKKFKIEANHCGKDINMIKSAARLKALEETKKTSLKKCSSLNLSQKQGFAQLIENECNEELGLAATTTPTDSKPNIDNLLYKFTSADTANPTTTDYVASLPEDATPGNIFSQIVYYMLIVANVMAFIGLVVSGAMMVISQGNDELLSKAKRIFTYTIIAMLIAALSLAVVTGITKIGFFNP